MRSAAAQCELDGPRITGPITSLKILIGIRSLAIVDQTDDWFQGFNDGVNNDCRSVQLEQPVLQAPCFRRAMEPRPTGSILPIAHWSGNALSSISSFSTMPW